MIPVLPVSPQLDPRKRNLAPTVPIQSSNKMEIKLILQNSEWYKNLSSSQKMMVNQLLAELSIELKRVHSDPTPTKMFDGLFINQRPLLQQVMSNLGVFINMKGEFEEFNEIANFPTHPMPTLAQMQLQPPPGNILNIANHPNLNMTAPPMLAPGWNGNRFVNEMRPGLLGMAPNIVAPNIRPFNFDHMQNMPNLPNLPNFGGNQDFGSNQNLNNMQNIQNMQNMQNFGGQNRNNSNSSNNNNNNMNSRGNNNSNNYRHQNNQGNRDHQRDHQNNQGWRNNKNMNNRSRNSNSNRD